MNWDFYGHPRILTIKLKELQTTQVLGRQSVAVLDMHGSVPGDWRDAILIPIPKKGDLSNCDNWRGISLLDIVGKAVARVLQDRLQKIAEDELPESQCGFRKGRGCTDMIFVVRQLVEKSWEHNSKAFFSFIDLKKAYDSVPREAYG